MNADRALILTMARADKRDAGTIIASLAFPVALLLVFGRLFGQEPVAGGGLASDFVGPNTMAFGVAFIGTFASAIRIVEWRTSGMMSLLRNAPIQPWRILGAAVAAGSIIAIIQGVLLVLVGTSPFIGMTLSPWSPLTLVTLLIGCFTFFSFGMFIGILAPTVASASMAIMLVVLPMGFFSGAMTPLYMLPDWVTTVSHFIPMTYLIEAIGGPLTGVFSVGEVFLGLGVLLGTGSLAFVAAGRLLRNRT